MTVDELPLMLTVDEAAGVLRIGRNSAYAAVADGGIPSVRIGRIIRIPRDALASLLGTGEVAAGRVPLGAPLAARGSETSPYPQGERAHRSTQGSRR